MSERGIMIAVVVALLGAAFFFPYESDDDYYAKHTKKPPAQKQDGKQQENSREVEAKGSQAEARLAVNDVPGGPGERGSGHRADPADPGAGAPLVEQVQLAQKQVESKKGGF